MIDRRSDQGKPQGDVDTLSESGIFQYRQALIVVHGKNAVCILQETGLEQGICGKWTASVNASLPCFFQCRRNHVNLFHTKVTVFTCMRVQACNQYFWRSDPEFVFEIIVDDRQDLH